mgnify:CR=1 FL=1
MNLHYTGYSEAREESERRRTEELTKDFQRKSREELQGIVARYEGANFLTRFFRLNPDHFSHLEYSVAEGILRKIN